MLPRSKVTAKYQVTIPKEVRESMGVRVGEIVSVEAVSKEEIRVKRSPKVTDPLKTLIGTRVYRSAVPIDELERKVESR